MKDTPPFILLMDFIIVGGWFIGLPAALVYGSESMSWLAAVATVWGITLAASVFAAVGIWHTKRWARRR